MRMLRIRAVVPLALAFTLALGQQPAEATADCLKWGVNFSVDLAPGYWATGYHSYEFNVLDDLTGNVFHEAGWFVVDASAPIHRGEVMFRRGLANPYSIDGNILNRRINPAQDTLFQLHNGDISGTRTGAEYIHEHVGIVWRWDDVTDWIAGTRSPVVPNCSADTNHAGFWLRDWGHDYKLQ